MSPCTRQSTPLASKKPQSTHLTMLEYLKGSNVFICWLVFACGAMSFCVKGIGSKSEFIKSSSKYIESSWLCVVKNSLFVTLSGNGRVIVGSSRISSLKFKRSITASSCSIKSRSKTVNRSREVCPQSPLLLKSFGDCGRII